MELIDTIGLKVGLLLCFYIKLSALYCRE